MTSLSRIASQVEEVDEQTFVRFCEYAYMGDYTPAQQQIVLPSSKLDNGMTLPLPLKNIVGDVVLKHPRRNFGTSSSVARILWLAPSL